MRWYSINTFLEDRYFIPFDTPRIIWYSLSTTSSPTRSLFLNSQSLRLPSSQYSNIMNGPTNVKNNLKNIIGWHCIINWNNKYVCFVDRWLSVVLFLSIIVLSVLLRYTDSDYLPLFGHCVVCSSSIYRFWLPPFVWSLCCLFFFDIRILITSLCLVIVLSVLLRYTDSDYLPLFDHCVVCSSSIYKFWLPPFVWSLCCLFFFDIQILITSLCLIIVLSVLLRYTDSDYLPLFGHCVVCSSSIYRFWLPPFVWSLCCLFFFDIQILITSLCLAIVLSVLLRYTDSDYLPSYLQTLRWTPFVFYRKKRDCQFACSSVTNRRHMSYYLISTFIGWMLFDVTYYHFSYISAIVFNHIGIMMIPPKLCNYLVCFLKKGTKHSQLYICIPCGNMYMSFGRCIVCHSIYCFWLPLWAS